MSRFPLETPFFLHKVRVEPLLHQIWRDGQALHLEPRMMHLLCVLAAHSGTVLTRDALLQTVWSDVVISDESLTKAISEVRKALGDNARQPRYIATVPKVGYRLVAPVRLDKPSPSPERSASRPASQQSRASHRKLWVAIVVLFGLVGAQWWYMTQPASEVPVITRVEKSVPIIVKTTLDGRTPSAAEAEIEAIVDAVIEQEVVSSMVTAQPLTP